MAITAAQLQVLIGADTSEADRGLKSVSDRLADFGKQAQQTGIALSAGVTAPLAGLGLAVWRFGSEFESAFAGVRKTVDATAEELATLRQGIRDMAGEVPATTTEIAAVAEAAGQLGIEVPNILEFTRTMVDLGVATNLSGEAAATALARLANITQMSQTEFDRLGSVVVELGNNLATTEAEIVEMGLRIAGAGSQIGLTEAQILGFAGALSSVGIEAQAGGSAISRVMIEMAAAASGTGQAMIDNSGAISQVSGRIAELESQLAIAIQRQSEFTDKTKQSTRMANQARIDNLTRQIEEQRLALGDLSSAHGTMVQVSADALTKFANVAGMSADEFSRAFQQDAAGAMITFIEGLGQMSAEGENVFAVLEDLELNEIRVRDALLRASGAGDLFRRSLEMGSSAWEENTALTIEAAQRYETIESRFQMLMNRVRDVAVTLFDILRPTISDLLDSGTQLIEWIGGLVGRLGELNPTILSAALAFGAIMAAAGPVLLIVSTMASALGALLAPLGLVIVAVAALGAAFVTNVGGIRDAAMGTLGRVGEFLQSQVLPVFRQLGAIAQKALGGDLGGALADLGNLVNTLGPQILAQIGDLTNRLMSWFGEQIARVDWAGILSGIQEIGPQLVAQLAAVDWSAIGQVISQKMREVWVAIRPAAGNLAEPLETAFRSVQDAIGKVIDTIQQALGIVGNVLAATFGDSFTVAWSKLSEAGSELAPLWDRIKQVGEAMLPVLQKIGIAVGAVLVTNIGVLLSAVRGLVTGISEAADNILRALQGVMQAFQGLFQFIGGIMDLIVALVKGDGEKIQDAWQQIKDGVVNIVQGLWTTVKELFIGAWELLKGLVGDFVSGIIGFFQSLYDALVGHSIIPDLVNDIIGWFTTLWQTGMDIFNAIKDFITHIWRSISASTEAAWNSIHGIISILLGRIQTTIGEVLGVIRPLWERIWGGIRDTTSRIWEGITGTVKGAINTIIGAINTLIRAWNGLELRIPGFGVDIPSIDIPGVGQVGGGRLGWGGLTVGTRDIPEIPMLATGGMVTRPTLAMLGEAGPEAVVPLRDSALLDALAERIAEAIAGRPTYTIHAHYRYQDERDLKDDVRLLQMLGATT